MARKTEAERLAEDYHKLIQEDLRRSARKELLAFIMSMRPDYEVNWHHRLICEFVDKIVAGKIKRAIISVPPRHGKALALTESILTFNRGWTTMADIQVGDFVFGVNGAPIRVIAKSDIMREREVYCVSSDDNQSVLADKEHLWSVRMCRKRNVYTVWNTEDLFFRQSPRRALIPQAKPIIFHKIILPIEPYTLGMWLGDGTSLQSIVTSHDDDQPFIRGRIHADGYETTNHKTKFTFGILNFKKLLISENLISNKHIPESYFKSSIQQRLDLLQGLIDSDGYVSPDGQVEFCSTIKVLAEGVQRLVHSLGRKCNIILGRSILNGIDHGEKYRAMFYMKDAASLPRKAIKTRDSGKCLGRYLSISKAGKADTVCIQVAAPDGLFLAGKGLMVTHNSEIVSRNLPAYWLGRFPNSEIISASYSQDLASAMNRDVQRIMDTREYLQVFPNTRINSKNGNTSSDNGGYLRNAEEFEVIGMRGKYRATGVGGGITGKGADLLILDDILKNWEEASSKTVRDKNIEWFDSTAYTRLSKDGVVIVMATRWHPEDLSGVLLERGAKDPNADQYVELTLPAIMDSDSSRYDKRTYGTALWPDRFPADRLMKIKAANPLIWSALYDQRPSAKEGDAIKREWIQTYRMLPDSFEEEILSADCTFKDTATADFVVIQHWGRKGANRYLINRWKKRADFPATIDMMLTAIAESPRAFKKLVEDKANGSAVISTLKSKITGLLPFDPRASKGARLAVCAPQFAGGNVFFPDPRDKPWVKDTIEEILAFPNGKHDDEVDAMTMALIHFEKGAGSYLEKLLKL